MTDELRPIIGEVRTTVATDASPQSVVWDGKDWHPIDPSELVVREKLRRREVFSVREIVILNKVEAQMRAVGLDEGADVLDRVIEGLPLLPDDTTAGYFYCPYIPLMFCSTTTTQPPRVVPGTFLEQMWSHIKRLSLTITRGHLIR